MFFEFFWFFCVISPDRHIVDGLNTVAATPIQESNKQARRSDFSFETGSDVDVLRPPHHARPGGPHALIFENLR